MSPPAVLEAADLAVGYRNGRRRAPVLEGLDLQLAPGELTCLLGPNGSGKSTLLRTLSGLQDPLDGDVRLLGDELSGLSALERARRLAVVLTDQPDIGLMRAADLVALGRHPHTGWSGRLGPQDQACVLWALRATGAAAFADRGVAELSDGERQRVLIARALAQQPTVLALDEPVAFVDVPRRVELTGLLRHLARECGLAVLLTTHDLDLAIRTADRLWLIEPGADQAAASAAGSGTATARVHVAAPEDLVLSGAVSRAFASDEVVFDLEVGAFRAHPGELGTVTVVGEGPAATWARRAVEREGFTLAPEASGLVRIEVLGPRAQPQWRLLVAGTPAVHTSIGDLVADLRSRTPVAAVVTPQ